MLCHHPCQQLVKNSCSYDALLIENSQRIARCDPQIIQVVSRDGPFRWTERGWSRSCECRQQGRLLHHDDGQHWFLTFLSRFYWALCLLWLVHLVDAIAFFMLKRLKWWPIVDLGFCGNGGSTLSVGDLLFSLVHFDWRCNIYLIIVNLCNQSILGAL